MKRLIPILIILISLNYFAKAQYIINGDASSTGTLEYQLTPDDTSKSGSVWYQTKINLNQNFSIAATLNFGVHDLDGADGIAFVLQPVSLNAGTSGGGLGYGGISPSVDVEFDTYENTIILDPAADHLGINVNGSTAHDSTSLLGSTILPNIEDGAWHTVLFTWDATNVAFTVIFDGTPYTIAHDFVNNVFSGNPFVYWGFTAATGGAKNDQRVRIGNVSFVEEINITANITDIDCANNPGAIDITVTGGTGGYQYSWTGPGAFTNSNDDITGLVAGPYTITVTDNSNASKSETFAVNSTSGTTVLCNITAVPSNNTYTGGVPTTIYLGYGPQSVQLNASANGGSGFTYAWTGNGTLSCTSCSNPVFSPGSDGLYNFNVHIENSGGCFTDCQISILVIDIRVPGHNNKVYLCHAPPGNPGNAHTLSISSHAVHAHLGHAHDHLGSCNLQVKMSSDNFENTSITELYISVLPNPSNGKFSVQLNYIEGTNADISVLDINGALVEKKSVVLGSDENSFDFDLNTQASGLYYVKVITEDATYIEKAFIQR